MLSFSLLRRPTRQQILRHCKYLIRRLEYEEIVKTNSIRAVGYLQTRLSDIIDHKDSDQLQEFHKLASLLFKYDDFGSDLEQNDSASKPSEAAAMSGECSSASSIMSSEDSSSASTSDTSTFKYSQNWSAAQRYNYTPPPPTICCYGANTLKKDAELFTHKTEAQQFEMKNQRCLLYNKLVELMPDHMVQPKENLSDFVLI